MSSKRVHNKSGTNDLKISTASAADIQLWSGVLNLQPKREVIGPTGTKCLLANVADGRLTISQRKVCYAYQLVAYNKFGARAISNVTASKTQDDLVISHLCGTRNCIVPDHIVLETKRFNDQRTHCHYSLQNVFERHGRSGVENVLALNLCDHYPKCGSTPNSVQPLSDKTNVERQKVRVENSLYNRKLQETPGKSLNTAAIGPTNSAAGAEETPPDRNNVRAGGTKRPGSCSPLGQSAAKLSKRERQVVVISDDENDEFLL